MFLLLGEVVQWNNLTNRLILILIPRHSFELLLVLHGLDHQRVLHVPVIHFSYRVIGLAFSTFLLHFLLLSRQRVGVYARGYDALLAPACVTCDGVHHVGVAAVEVAALARGGPTTLNAEHLVVRVPQRLLLLQLLSRF